MSDRLELLSEWMKDRENEHLEFKEAKTNFHFEKLVEYCVALANEGGGKMILGVTDRRPRKVVGTLAFSEPPRTQAGLLERLHFRVDAEEIAHPDGRVLVFHVPSRPVGIPIQYNGKYLMRGGEDLAPMTHDQLKRILDEAEPDYSAGICAGASLADLDHDAIEQFRELWILKSRNQALKGLTHDQLLRDAELLIGDQMTYAALILFGTKPALGKYLAQAEVIFEYRSNESSGPPAQRAEFRQGFIPVLDMVWELINRRNDKQPFQDGLIMYDIPTFNERAIREVLLNAVTHRDYRLAGSTFVRQYPRRLEVVSPGGFPPGITQENILWQQSPRNRRVAEAISKTGLVERAGQGMNLMYETCIRESKRVPDFTGTDDFHVWVTLHGDIQDERFLRFLEKVGRERLDRFTTKDFLALDLAHRGQRITPDLRLAASHLIDQGIIEPAGNGRYMLSRALYSFLGQKGIYTRRRGLDRETNKALLLRHITDNDDEGSKLEELMQVLPSLSRRQVQRFLEELKKSGSIHSRHRTSAARWHAGPDQGQPKSKG
jgi:ATP-dependent DNA helicase RecG